MRALVWRYVSAMHRKCEESVVTEDDINELKSDVSSFRYEILEVLSKNGMDVSSAEKKGKGIYHLGIRYSDCAYSLYLLINICLRLKRDALN